MKQQIIDSVKPNDTFSLLTFGYALVLNAAIWSNVVNMYFPHNQKVVDMSISDLQVKVDNYNKMLDTVHSQYRLSLNKNCVPVLLQGTVEVEELTVDKLQTVVNQILEHENCYMQLLTISLRWEILILS